MKNQDKQVGLTKDVGWQFGLRKTFPYSQEYFWDFMFSDKGLNLWLGKLEGELEIKKAYKTKDGIEGLVRVFTPNSHIRMTWKKKNWSNISTVQVRVIGNSEKATIIFHQEKLIDENQRNEMKSYWNRIMIEIEKAIMTEK
jgi:hypothetical protein